MMILLTRPQFIDCCDVPIKALKGRNDDDVDDVGVSREGGGGGQRQLLPLPSEGAATSCPALLWSLGPSPAAAIAPTTITTTTATTSRSSTGRKRDEGRRTFSVYISGCLWGLNKRSNAIRRRRRSCPRCCCRCRRRRKTTTTTRARRRADSMTRCHDMCAVFIVAVFL